MTREIWQAEGDPQQCRHSAYLMSFVRLQALANKALARGLGPHDFVVVCIHVDDPAWRELVDILMPGEDWEAYRQLGMDPFARGTVVAEGFIETLAAQVPGIGPQLLAGPPAGKAHVVVMAQGGASLYAIPVGGTN